MSDEYDKVKMATESDQTQDKRVSTTTLMMRKKEPRAEPEEESNLEREKELSSESNSVLDDTWAELTQDWQAQPTPTTDIIALMKRTRRRTYGAKFCFLLNIVTTLGLIIAFFYGLLYGIWGEAANIYLGLGSLLSIIFVYFETKIRVATWSQLCDSPEKAIENAIASSESSMKYMWITKISLLPFLPLVNWFIYSESQTSEKAVLPVYLVVNGFILAVYLVVSYLHRKRQREYQQLLQVKKV